MEKFYIVYKTTNIITGRFYIGSHQTSNINDGYIGSGKVLKMAVRKYGRDNFKFEIICKCISFKIMRCVEGHLVRYNIDKFGRGCYNRSYNGTGAVLGVGNAFYGKSHSDSTKRIISEKASVRNVGEGNPFYGKHHTPHSIEKIKSNRPNFENCQAMREYFTTNTKQWFCTPEGCFTSDRVASDVTGLNRNSIRSRCLNPDKVVKPNYQIDSKFWGKTWRENGYYYVDRITAKD
jgi:hypothetical protein